MKVVELVSELHILLLILQGRSVTMDEENLRNKLESHMDGLLIVNKSIEERLKILEEKEKNINLLEEKMRQSAEKAKQKIKFDVGGKIFSTSKTTLLQHQGTYFYALLGSDHWKPDKDGKIMMLFLKV
jgi:hypothetical protein